MTYSVVIRTLALSPDTLRQVLTGVFAQTIRPEKVIVYIAENYSAPSWRVGNEAYIHVKKGMMAQRALPYDDIGSDYILMLDDDLLLSSPSTVADMLYTADTHHTDLLGADPFQTHRLPLKSRIFAALTSLVLPHSSQKKAFILRSDGSFSYISSPAPRFYPSDTCAGPIMLWRTSSYKQLHLSDEIWIDSFGFAYADDALLSYKATANNMRVGIDFRLDITNLDSRTESDRYRKDSTRFYIRSKAIFANWWRMCYKPHGNHNKGNGKALFAGALKFLWLTPVMLTTALATREAAPFILYIRGLIDGYRFVHSHDFESIRPYINPTTQELTSLH